MIVVVIRNELSLLLADCTLTILEIGLGFQFGAIDSVGPPMLVSVLRIARSLSCRFEVTGIAFSLDDLLAFLTASPLVALFDAFFNGLDLLALGTPPHSLRGIGPLLSFRRALLSPEIGLILPLVLATPSLDLSGRDRSRLRTVLDDARELGLFLNAPLAALDLIFRSTGLADAAWLHRRTLSALNAKFRRMPRVAVPGVTIRVISHKRMLSHASLNGKTQISLA